MVRKEKGAPLPAVMPMCPGLSARFCRRLLSNMEEVLDARLSLVLPTDMFNNFKTSAIRTTEAKKKISFKKYYWSVPFALDRR